MPIYRIPEILANFDTPARQSCYAEAVELDKINTAVRSILDACYSSGDPLVALQAEMHELRQSGKWSERQIGEVRTAVLGILMGMAAGQQ